MRKITLLCLAFILPFGMMAQELPLDFEQPEDDNFVPFNGATSAVVTDPTDATNSVLELAGNGAPFDGATLQMATYVDLSDDSNNTMTLEIWAPDGNTRTHLLKLENSASNNAPTELTFTTNMMGWQTVSIDFGPGLDADYPAITLFPDFNNADTGTYYIDNITGTNGAPVPPPGGIFPPTSLAPTPPARPANSTLSIYGDAYGTPVGLNNVPWDDPSSITEESHAGGDVLKADIANGNFFGSSLGTQSDASTMTNFHLDVWISDAFEAGQVLNLKISNHNPAGAGGETNAYEYSYAVGANDSQSWVSIDVPVTDWTNVETQAGFNDLEYVTEFLITTAGTIDVFYMDNFYFHQNTLGVDSFETTSFSAFPNPSQDVWNIKSDNVNIQNVQVYNTLGRLVKTVDVNGSEAIIDASDLSNGIYFAKVYAVGNNSNTIKLIKK